jgi:MscS family membrane protein
VVAIWIVVSGLRNLGVDAVPLLAGPGVGGLDTERGKAATQEVKAWRKSGKLPFPRLSPEKMDQLEGTLDYPPRGPVEARLYDPQWREAPEPLPVDSEPEQPEKEKEKEKQ